MKIIKIICFLLPANFAFAGDLVYQFVSPSFNGIGYSAHVLTIENQEKTRRVRLRDERRADADALARAAANTNFNKFLGNLESRIYAQLSKQLADQLFAESGATRGQLDFAGTNIAWYKTDTDVVLTILREGGGVTEITVPVGQFKF
jgi:hypothetical protein